MSQNSTPPSFSQRLRQGLKGHRGEYLVAIQFALIFIFAFMPAWHPGIDGAVLASLRPWLLPLVIPAALVAVAFGALGSMHLGEYITPLPYPVDHNRLVRTGIYGIVRHPLYASQIFAAFAWTLYNLSLSHLAVLVLGFAFFNYKAGKEENWLTERHPDYPDYARTVRKFIPWIY